MFYRYEHYMSTSHMALIVAMVQKWRIYKWIRHVWQETSIDERERERETCKVEVKCNIVSQYCFSIPYLLFSIAQDWRDFKYWPKIPRQNITKERLSRFVVVSKKTILVHLGEGQLASFDMVWLSVQKENQNFFLTSLKKFHYLCLLISWVFEDDRILIRIISLQLRISLLAHWPSR